MNSRASFKFDHSDSELVNVGQNVIEAFKSLYCSLNADTLDNGMIQQVYTEDMCFEDSFHTIEGREAFQAYCDALYTNVSQITFEFHDELLGSGEAMLTWTMSYQHPRLNKGREISVEGASHIRFRDQVYYHRDYFDGGQLLYEQIPLLGGLIQKLKKRMAQ